jgi:GntR family transcriptional regulator, transcriptional repressor for pyruvate dehydrogenase complex
MAPRSSKKRSVARGPSVAGGDPREPAPRKADRVARDLLSRIVSGDIKVGAVLPREDELASSFGVNRSVVREAVKLLEVHRLVRPVRRRGTVVLDPLGSMSAEVLVAMLAPRPGRVDRHVLAGFLEVRALLDASMSALAAERRTQADVRALRACVADLEDAMHDPPRYGRVLDELPRLLARAAKNPLFEMFAAYNVRVASELGAALSVMRPASREHVDGIRIVVDLIAQKDAASVRRVVSEFHAWGTPRILAAASLANGEPLHRVAKEIER